MQYRRSFVFIGPIVILLGFYLIRSNSSSNDSYIHIDTSEKHRGVCWVGGPQIVYASDLEEIASKGVNWISQTPFGWQRGHDNPNIGNQIGSSDGWWGERDEGLVKTTEMARAEGIKTILKPHIWLRDEEGKWRGEIAMNTEEDWQMWFAQYEEFILHYARLAEESKMDMLCIGTELHQTCVQRENDWRALIGKIREVYKGPLTYAANFSGEYQEVSFWDELDYIGVQAYFPLSSKESPSIEDLKSGWSQPLKELQSFSNRYNKPILFTEIGYKSTKDSGKEPWTWPQRLPREERASIYSEEMQAQLYEAMMQEVMSAPFIAGIHLWKWYPNYQERIDRMKERSGNSTYYDIDFTPQGKQAERVMEKWFSEFQ